MSQPFRSELWSCAFLSSDQYVVFQWSSIFERWVARSRSIPGLPILSEAEQTFVILFCLYKPSDILRRYLSCCQQRLQPSCIEILKIISLWRNIEEICKVKSCVMSAGCSKMTVDQISNLPSSLKSVVFLRSLLFNSEVWIGDNFRLCRLFASSISVSGKSQLSSDCDVIRSSTDLATSTSLTHNSAIVRHPEWEHTSVFKLVFQNLESEDSGNLSKCRSEIWFLGIFHLTILKASSSCTIQRS